MTLAPRGVTNHSRMIYTLLICLGFTGGLTLELISWVGGGGGGGGGWGGVECKGRMDTHNLALIGNTLV